MALASLLCVIVSTSPVNKPLTPPAHPQNSGFSTLSMAQMQVIQDNLSWLGYYHGRIDGLFDQHVWLAVESFQEDHGLIADGLPGPDTRLLLEDVVSESC